MDDIPLLIDFAGPSSIFREQNRTSALRILGNGPPGTFVLFPGRFKVSLPTDQIVFADDTGGHARVGFGGMHFVGPDQGQLVFVRAREVLAPDQLSPDRSRTMRLEPQWVASVSVNGQVIWHRPLDPTQAEQNRAATLHALSLGQLVAGPFPMRRTTAHPRARTPRGGFGAGAERVESLAGSA